MQLLSFGATVLVDGRQLTGAVDRIAEARLQAQLVPEDAPEAWVYGCGLGDLVGVLLERPAMRRLHACVLSAELHQRLQPLTRFGDDSRIVVHQPGEVRDIQIPFAVVPGELRHAEPAAHALRDNVMAVLNTPFNDLLREVTADLWARQERENAPLLEVDQHVSVLMGTDRRPAMVVAGGPTASDHFDHIRSRREDCSLIAASRVLLPLLAAGIAPDVVVNVDPYPGARPFFPPSGGVPGARLVYLVNVEPSIPRCWPGPRCWLREGDLFTGGSVVHAAADLATKMGAPEVHLFGADFCFPGGRSHIEGAAGDRYDVEHAMLRAVNGLGELAPTQESMAQYHRGLEVLIAERPGVRWVKHDRRGVPLAGAVWFDEDSRATRAA